VSPARAVVTVRATNRRRPSRRAKRLDVVAAVRDRPAVELELGVRQ
jgi:hypothetical protein